MRLNIKLKDSTTLSRIDELEKILNLEFSDVVQDYFLEVN